MVDPTVKALAARAGEEPQALKSLCLLSPSYHPEIPIDLYMNGVVSLVPWRGRQEYILVWYMSVLPITLEKSAICHAVVKTDQHRINLLKMARFTFDRVYHDGAKSVVNVISLPWVRNHSETRCVGRPTTTHATRTANTVEAGAICHRQSIANMRMAPINSQFASNAHSNQLAAPDDDYDNSLRVEVDGQLQEDEDPAEVDFFDRTEDDILHGYLPDASYNPASMEEDGTYPQELNWSYSDVVPGTPNTNYPCYNGNGLCLRRYVDRKFETLLGACGTAGGFSYELVKRIKMNSNNYVRERLVGNKFYGSDWKNITVVEMFHAFGMILKMSLVSICLGGLKAYFNPITKLYISCNEAIELKTVDTNWTNDRLTYKHFLQIRAAIHPEDGTSEIGDKCHQLRAAIQFLNGHAKKSFILGRELSFDEGGIASKSRYNPVRQYNSSKPDKCRIDFFVLVNASCGKNFTYHLDVYQGKNATNAVIAAKAHTLLMTQKAVVNSIVLSGIANKPYGMREIYMDNRYSTPTLFVLLRENYKTLACGTVRSNHMGWNPQILNLPKTSQRGTSLVKFDPVNRVLFGQWNNNKVVSFISTLGVFGMSTIQQRVGANKIDFQIPEALKKYSADNFMGGIDNMDKDKKIGGLFT